MGFVKIQFLRFIYSVADSHVNRYLLLSPDDRLQLKSISEENAEATMPEGLRKLIESDRLKKMRRRKVPAVDNAQEQERIDEVVAILADMAENNHNAQNMVVVNEDRAQNRNEDVDMEENEDQNREEGDEQRGMEVEINVEDLIAEDIDPDEDIERFRVFVEVAAQRGELERQRLQEGEREQPAAEREIVRRMIEGREERRRLERGG